MCTLAIPSSYGAMRSSAGELAPFVAGPYELVATFMFVMLFAALVLVAFMRPGTMARLIAGVPFSLFILSMVSILLQATTGIPLMDFTIAEAPSPTLSTLRLAAELLCYLAAWKCIPWLYEGKERLIDFFANLLTRR